MDSLELMVYIFIGGFFASVLVIGGIVEIIRAHKERKAKERRREHIRQRFVVEMAVLNVLTK